MGPTGGSRGRLIRLRYDSTYMGYDELYRAEQYEKYSLALKRIPPAGSVLDAGCGTGLLAEYMAVMGYLDRVSSYTCLDYSWGMLSVASWRLRTLCPGRCVAIHGNVEYLPFPPRTFDRVYSFTVLDLVDDLVGSLRGLLRVSRGPVVVSMMERLRGKEVVAGMGAKPLGSTGKDVVFVIGEEAVASGGGGL